MIAIISPAKTLDFETPAPGSISTIPQFAKQADFLAARLARLSNTQLAQLLDISPKLAQLNTERYNNWKNASEKQAIFAFAGDVYDGLDAATLDEQQLDFAQSHIRIISGLYGLLKPFDKIKPHRIEMGTAFKTTKADSLYKYWGNAITSQLVKDLKTAESNILINLASQEYFAAIDTQKLKARIITPIFKDFKNEKYSIISFFTKKTRGMMCRYISENQITDYEMLVGFDNNGYNFNHGLSTKDNWVFTRG